MKGKIRTDIKFKFEFDEEIPNLDLELSSQNKEDNKKTKIIIHKKIKNGRDTSTNNSSILF